MLNDGVVMVVIRRLACILADVLGGSGELYPRGFIDKGGQLYSLNNVHVLRVCACSNGVIFHILK